MKTGIQSTPKPLLNFPIFLPNQYRSIWQSSTQKCTLGMDRKNPKKEENPHFLAQRYFIDIYVDKNILLIYVIHIIHICTHTYPSSNVQRNSLHCFCFISDLSHPSPRPGNLTIPKSKSRG